MEELTICNLLPLQSLRTRNNRGGGRRGNPGTNLFRCNIAVICWLLCALFVFKQNRISSVAYASPLFFFFFPSAAPQSLPRKEKICWGVKLGIIRSATGSSLLLADPILIGFPVPCVLCQWGVTLCGKHFIMAHWARDLWLTTASDKRKRVWAYKHTETAIHWRTGMCQLFARRLVSIIFTLPVLFANPIIPLQKRQCYICVWYTTTQQL